MQTLAQIKEILAEHGLSPRHALGQNFLLDHNLIRKLVDASGAHEGDVILEVGPGTGTLTEELLARGCRVVACELDKGLAAMLRQRLADPQALLSAPPSARFALVEGDCLASKSAINPELIEALTSMMGSGTTTPPTFRLVANLPYGAATPLMIALLVDHPACRSMHVTIQREVADRLLAGPRSDDYGPLSVLAGTLATVQRVATLPPECFWPRPDVTSAMVSITRRDTPLTDDPRGLGEFCQMLFSKRRKQIGSTLGRARAFPPGIRSENRVEELSPEQIIELHRAFRAAGT